MREALVFGASGQIGTPVLARLRRDGWWIHAVSRSMHIDDAQVHWLRGDLQSVDGVPAGLDAIVSCGPLDHFARWYAGAPVQAVRVVAFGSTSVSVKADSADAAERDVAVRLAAAERAVFDTAATRGAVATVLRPTLVYGTGRDATLTRIATLARRWRRFVLPRGACGLRQPVHVDDLADAAMSAIACSGAGGHAYDLPGGDTLPYRDMVSRVLSALEPPAALVEVPAGLFNAALWLARHSGRAAGLGDAAVARMRMDLVFDASPARGDLGYRPRAFHPTAAMFRAAPVVQYDQPSLR